MTLGSNTAVTLSFPVTISRKSASYTHTLTLKTGNTTLATATGVGTTHSFSVSTLALYRACPGALSQALILTCETKRGSATIGTASASGTLTLLLANCRPTLTSYASGGFTFYEDVYKRQDYKQQRQNRPRQTRNPVLQRKNHLVFWKNFQG